MKSTDIPKLMPVPFGINGNREELLAKSLTGDNTASYNDGFPPITMTLKSAGGLPPKGQDMNQILYELADAQRWANTGACYQFDEAWVEANGGYPKGAMLSDGDAIWMSTIDDNKTATGGDGWVKVIDPNRDTGFVLASDIVQTTGTSTTSVMSQKAVTDALRGSELIQSANQIIKDTNGNVSDFNNAKGNAVFFGYATALNNAAITGVGIDIAQVNNDYHLQLISAFHGNGIAFRTKNGDTKTWNDWNKFFHTGNVKVDRNGNLKTNDTSDALSDCCVGTPLPWPQNTVPSGFLACNGQSFDKAAYPLLAAAYPSGVLPDLRGEFIRGLDAGRNIDNGRAALSAQGDAIRKIEGEIGQVIVDSGAKNTGAFADLNQFGKLGDGSLYPLYSASFDSSRVVPTANENRPRNIAFLYIVRAA